MLEYGTAPECVGRFDFDLPEFMHYQYLPVMMDGDVMPPLSPNVAIRLPANVECCRALINAALECASFCWVSRGYRYAYLTAKKGFATADNPLNRPGWHCDGFGSDDLNFIWWVGPGTRFAVQPFGDISTDHVLSLEQFEEQVMPGCVRDDYPQRRLYCLPPNVVHATPVIEPPGGMRQFVKVSLSDRPYNLEDNSHNYLFDYSWKMWSRDALRNDPAAAQADHRP